MRRERGRHGSSIELYLFQFLLQHVKSCPLRRGLVIILHGSCFSRGWGRSRDQMIAEEDEEEPLLTPSNIFLIVSAYEGLLLTNFS